MLLHKLKMPQVTFLPAASLLCLCSYLPGLIESGVVCHMQGDGTAMASASVVRALKDALLSVLRCRAPQALTWHNKV